MDATTRLQLESDRGIQSHSILQSNDSSQVLNVVNVSFRNNISGAFGT